MTFLGHNIVTERSLSQLNESLYTLQVELDYLYELDLWHERDAMSKDISDVPYKIIFQLVIDILLVPTLYGSINSPKHVLTVGDNVNSFSDKIAYIAKSDRSPLFQKVVLTKRR